MMIDLFAAPGTIEKVLTGLRIGAIILWAWVGLRVAFDSQEITGEDLGVREQGWRFFRAHLLVMSAIVVFLFSPADILIANGMIERDDRMTMNILGVIGLHISGILLHVGLDVSNHHTKRALPIYLAISALCLAFGLWRPAP